LHRRRDLLTSFLIQVKVEKKNERRWTKNQQNSQSPPNIAKPTFPRKVDSEKLFSLKMSTLKVDSNFYKEKE